MVYFNHGISYQAVLGCFFCLGFAVFAGCVSTRFFAFFCVFVRLFAFIRVSLRL
jgi:hypothetical protein